MLLMAHLGFASDGANGPGIVHRRGLASMEVESGNGIFVGIVTYCIFGILLYK